MKYLPSSIATLAFTVGLAHAQGAQVPDNLDKLSNFQTTGVTEFTFVEQGGDYAEGIKATLDKIALPDGFKIDLYAVVPDARHMAVGPQGVATFVGTRKDKVWTVTDRNKDRVADEVKDFAPSLQFSIPNGPCFSETAFSISPSRTGFCCFRRLNSFMKAPTWRRSIWWPRAI